MGIMECTRFNIELRLSYSGSDASVIIVILFVTRLWFRVLYVILNST